MHTHMHAYTYACIYVRMHIRSLWQVLDNNGILGERTVADASALKSEPCVPPGTSAEAALLGRQPAHTDAPLDAPELLSDDAFTVWSQAIPMG